jgi:hypothetical protein
MNKLSLALALLLSSSALGYAQEQRSATVPAGKRTGIATLGVFMQDSCVAAGGNPRVTVAPANGKAEIARARMRNTSRTAACTGVEFDGHALYYTPRAGFRGTDSLTITMDVFNGRVEVPRTVVYQITVK